LAGGQEEQPSHEGFDRQVVFFALLRSVSPGPHARRECKTSCATKQFAIASRAGRTCARCSECIPSFLRGSRSLLVFATSRDLHAFTEAELLSRRALTRQPHIRADRRPTPLSPIRAGGVPKRAAPIWRTELVAQGLLRQPPPRFGQVDRTPTLSVYSLRCRKTTPRSIIRQASAPLLRERHHRLHNAIGRSTICARARRAAPSSGAPWRRPGVP
jgi:hypothetical protein